MCEQATVPRRSLYHEAWLEALRHKWIESQKHGFDLGPHAIANWYKLYWTVYCRYRHLEHLRGYQYWIEFDYGDFGQLTFLDEYPDLLCDRIIDRVHQGYENLDIIDWAREWGLPMHRVLDILTLVNINQARLEPNPDSLSCAAC